MIQEVEAAGGKALAIECDIRNDEQIHRAVQQVSVETAHGLTAFSSFMQAVEKFGFIDIVVNNASAIWFKPTLVRLLRYYFVDLIASYGCRRPR